MFSFLETLEATIIFSDSQENIWSVGKQYLGGFLKKQGNVTA